MKIGAVFDGTFHGFMTIVYKYYYEKFRPDVILAENEPFQLDINTETRPVVTHIDNAERALTGVMKRFSTPMYERICGAFINCEPTRFTDIFNYIILCFRHGNAADGFTQETCVINTHRLARNSWHEFQWLRGFTRFKDTANHTLYADISPMNDVLCPLADFFADRLKGEKWVLHDVRRKKAAIFNGAEWIVSEAPDVIAHINEHTDEDFYESLWVVFYHSLNIDERYNPKLQKAMKPKRYWKHMTEHKRARP